MVEPSRSAPVKRLLNFVRTGLPFVRCREELAWLENLLQEVLAGQPRVLLLPAEAGIDELDEPQFQELRSGTLRRGSQVGYGHCNEVLSLPYPPFVEILQALLDRPALRIERTLSTNLQDWVALQHWAGRAQRRDHEAEYCRAHAPEVIKTYCLAGNILGMAAVVVRTTQTYLKSCFRSSQYPGRLKAPISVQYSISACVAMRPLLIVTEKFSAQKEDLP